MRCLYLLLLLPLVGFSCRADPNIGTGPAVRAGAERLLAPDELFGALFRRVQLEQIFPDGKTFVDMIPRRSAADIMADYRANHQRETFDLRTFVTENFDPPATPPSVFTTDASRGITEHIDYLWPVLTRRAGSDEGSAGSLLVLPEDYVVPGGRFREVYYWDSYFTMLGLATAGEDSLIRNMVENFAYLIDEVGFIPNGNRTYYLTRSQPPFFSLMVDVLAGIEGEEVYGEFLPQLKAEYAFWMDGEEVTTASEPAVRHVVRISDSVHLNRYYDAADRPRAESYREDVLTIRESGRDSQEVARHLRSAAESGWDFSARWFADGASLASIITTDIVPPDLNALLYHLEMTIAEHAGSAAERAEYTRRGERRREAVEAYLWNPATEWYEDRNWKSGEFTGYLTLAGVYPLFVGLAGDDHATAVARGIEQRFLAPGGLRTSLATTGQQWDAPNGWPPLQWMSYAGLRDYGHDRLATMVRDRWTENNERVFANVGKLVEKYNVEDITLEAGGGEYPVQDGFGWSNGVYLRMTAEQD